MPQKQLLLSTATSGFGLFCACLVSSWILQLSFSFLLPLQSSVFFYPFNHLLSSTLSIICFLLPLQSSVFFYHFNHPFLSTPSIISFLLPVHLSSTTSNTCLLLPLQSSIYPFSHLSSSTPSSVFFYPFNRLLLPLHLSSSTSSIICFLLPVQSSVFFYQFNHLSSSTPSIICLLLPLQSSVFIRRMYLLGIFNRRMDLVCVFIRTDLLGILVTKWTYLVFSLGESSHQGVFIRRKYLPGRFLQENGPTGHFRQGNGPTWWFY